MPSAVRCARVARRAIRPAIRPAQVCPRCDQQAEARSELRMHVDARRLSNRHRRAHRHWKGERHLGRSDRGTGSPCSIKHSLGGLTSRRKQRRVHHMGWRRLPISYHLAGFPDFLPIPPLPYCAHRRTPAPTLSCAVAFFAVPVVRRRMNLRCAQWHGTTRSGHTSYQQT
jgi:hypothetical protein